MLLFLLTAEDCADSRVEPSKADVRIHLFQGIENEFTSDMLSDEALLAFEKRAEQKLVDLIDYLNIYADSGISIEFREQAKQMIGDAFISSSDVQQFYKNLELTEDITKTILLKGDTNLFHTEVTSIDVIQSFQKRSNSEYVGEIQFVQMIDKNTISQHLEILAVKTSKNFGNETLIVWKMSFSQQE